MKNQIKILDKEFILFIEEEKIQNRVTQLAEQINNDYKDKVPTFLIVLKGALLFAADLLKRIKVRCKVELISAKSYGNEMESSGTVKLKHLESNFKNKDIIIIEDVIDTGLTMKTLLDDINKYEPNSIEVAAILTKPNAIKTDVNIKYVGFEIDNLFVVGYGLDYAEFGRELPDIYVLKV